MKQEFVSVTLNQMGRGVRDQGSGLGTPEGLLMCIFLFKIFL